VSAPAVTELPLHHHRLIQAVDDIMYAFLDAKATARGDEGRVPAEAVEMVRDFLAAERKRLRPVLCGACWSAGTGQVAPPPAVVQVAASLEIPGIRSPAGRRPAVLARQVGHEAAQVVQGVRPRLTAGEERGQIGRELVELLLEQQGIYAGRRGRLIFRIRHNTMINRRPRPRSSAPTPPAVPSDHKVRLEYQPGLQ
jgi:hypothetical protein